MTYKDELLQEIPKGLLMWYNFKENSQVLYIGNKDNRTEFLEEKKCQLCCVCAEEVTEEFIKVHKTVFDYIIIIKSLEECANPKELLINFQKCLKPSGKLLIGMNNRFGLRYFCGDRDPYTGRNFDGIESYRRAFVKKEDAFLGQCYNKAEIEEILEESGWSKRKFYSVLPDLDRPQLIYAEDYLPVEELGIRYSPMYNYPDSVFLEEEFLYTDLIKNGMFHVMANAYFIECSLTEDFANINHVTLSLDRGRENSLITIIRNDHKVEKRAAYIEGQERLSKLLINAEDLRAHSIKVVEAAMEGTSYVMPYIEAEVAVTYLRRLIREDKDKFIAEIDRFRNLILQSSEVIEPDKGDGKGAILEKGYLDLVPLNCFYIDGKYIFYDQEFWEENYPANAIITRMLDIIYMSDGTMESILPRGFFFERYGLKQELEQWRRLGTEFVQKLRNQRELRSYQEQYGKNWTVIHTNRQRMNYSANEYQRIFVDLFRNTENKKLFVFGSGKFAQKFLALFGKNHPVEKILDNNPTRWGTQLEGITIVSPEILRDMSPQEYKVIICIKSYLSVQKQLLDIGVKDYGIYDVNIEYPRELPIKKEAVVAANSSKEQKAKKYHVGYIAGVFDLFHVGHLNMFKRAKKQCDYLIVGVVTDEGVRKHKKVEPFIPFEERIEMVRSCRYVDEAVEIPLNYAGTRDAYRLYHFDCQFSGSDYVDNPDWLAEKAFLEKNGADLVFFPYTEGTSSTKIKAMIEKSLI